MTLKIFAFSNVSTSARSLADGLDVRLLRHTGSTWHPKDKSDLILNWGYYGNLLDNYNCRILNKPDRVAIASNKLKFFEAIREYNNKRIDTNIVIPNFFISKQALTRTGERKKVFARTELNGHSGAGIVDIPPDLPPNQIVSAPLYVEYIPKMFEYRVHVFCGKVIDIARKIADPDREVTNWQVRSHSNGFIFARENLNIPKEELLRQMSISVVEAIGLDFGAVDIIYNSMREQYYVLEINTAPGLVGTTLTNYINAIEECK